MLKSIMFIGIALLTMTAPTPAELYTCGQDCGCSARINEDGELKEVTFRKGDTVDTGAGWVVSTDDGWSKVKSSGATSGQQGPGGNVTYYSSSSEVANGSRWMWGGSVVTARVTDPRWTEPTDVTVGVSDPGNSPQVPGSGGPTSTPDSPTADDSDVMLSPSGTRYRVENGKLQRWNPRSGQWVDGKLLQTPISSGGATH